MLSEGFPIQQFNLSPQFVNDLLLTNNNDHLTDICSQKEGYTERATGLIML